MATERIGTIALFAATVLVAISILLDGTIAKILNGMAGLTWFSAAALLVLAGWQVSKRRELWLAIVVLTCLVAFVVKPTDFVPAVIGFGAAGLLVALLARGHALLWAKVVVGLYLPFHIGTAVTRAVVRSATGGEASIRSEPPPTAAIIPLIMLFAALAGALLAQRWLEGRGGKGTVSHGSVTAR